MKLRVQFSKEGPMKFIGHLDTMRYFQRAVRRSGIDVAYTGGYSPHQVMAFAQPLGIGTESDSEIMDIEVNDITPGREALIRMLDGQMCEGFAIRDIRLLPDDAVNAMASVSAASYSVYIKPEARIEALAHNEDKTDGSHNDVRTESGVVSYEDMTARIMASDEVMILKKTKKSEQMTDIRPRIYELYVQDDRICMCVDASSGGNIKPGLVIDAMYKTAGFELPEGALKVRRTEIYGTDSEGQLKPLIEFGTDF